MTRDELLTAVLVERFGPDAAQSRPAPLQPWQRQVLEAALSGKRQVVGVPRRETRQQIIDDLPPDSRPHPVIVQAARS